MIADDILNDTRNVIDEYKGLPNEEIKNRIKENMLPFACAMEHWRGDFNLSSLLRNANAFGAMEVFYIGGRKHWDRRGACGVMNYSDISFLRTIDELLPLKEKYKFIGVDNIPGSVPIESFVYPKEKCLFIFGEEGCGLTKEVVGLCEALISITQFGSVRSLNAACASAVVMYDYRMKYGKQ